ncbi:SHOCT domain-containing protein [Rhizobium sp. SL42]|uniref:SHOCT domain-containing protein n=1 Tax=Rhizobium sp. SL42 TaxID=2806346 RepID=UPI001F3917DB|nr:SHOCT domain-containing protein [Rhizobium sp. SL42]
MAQTTFSLKSLTRPAHLAAIIGMLAASGCQSSAETPTVTPTPSALQVTVDDVDAPEQAAPRPTSKDGFPNFGGSLNAANVQMNNEEAAALQQQLTALSSARQSGSITEAEYQRKLAELRTLAAQHGPETQAQIAK